MKKLTGYTGTAGMSPNAAATSSTRSPISLRRKASLGYKVLVNFKMDSSARWNGTRARRKPWEPDRWSCRRECPDTTSDGPS